MDTQYIVYVDGSKTPNTPDGIACWGFLVNSHSGERTYAHYGSLGKGISSNVSEYYAIFQALKFCADFPEFQYTIRSDSKNTIDQLNGLNECRADSLIPYYQACLRLLSLFHSKRQPTLEWIPRERNIQADSLTRKAHDYAVKSKNVESLALEAWYVRPWKLCPE